MENKTEGRSRKASSATKFKESLKKAVVYLVCVSLIGSNLLSSSAFADVVNNSNDTGDVIVYVNNEGSVETGSNAVRSGSSGGGSGKSGGSSPVIAEDEVESPVITEDETGSPVITADEISSSVITTDNVESAANAAKKTSETVVYQEYDDGITVTVEAPEGALPDDAELIVQRYSTGSDEFTDAAEAIGHEADDENMAALDIHFELDGEEVEPIKEVTVSIDVSDILPENVDPETIEVTHLEEIKFEEDDVEENDAEEDEESDIEELSLVETAKKVKPVVVANKKKGELDKENAIATFSVKSFSSFTITWGTGNSETEVIVYLYDINGLGIYDSDEQGTYTWAAGEHTIANLVSEHVSGKISDSYTYVYATVQYLTTSNQGGSVTTIGSESDPVTSVSWNGTNYVVTTQNGSTTTVTKSDTVAAEFYINLYFSTPTVEISVTSADSENHTVSLIADAENFQNNNISYSWDIISGEEYASITGNGADATVTWNSNDESGNTITVRVTAESASGERAVATYELVYGMQQVTYTVYYGTTETSGTIASGASVALLDENGNVVSNGTTNESGQVTLWVVPGTEYTLEASYTASSGSGMSMTYVHYSYEDGSYTYASGDATNIYMTESEANLYEHVDVKLSIADPDSEGYSDILANVDYVNIYDEAGDLVYQSSQLVHNSGTNDYNVLFADADGNVGTNPHSIAFYDSYTIVIGYEVSYTYEEEGETKEYTESYVATINKNSTYIEDEYYSYSGTNAYQLYNELYGTDYDEDSFAAAVAAGEGEGGLQYYNEHGIALEGLSYFTVAAALCDTKDRSGQAGLDLALGVNSLRRYSSTTWIFDIQKTLVNSATTAGQFTFDLYEASTDEQGNWYVDVSAYQQEGSTNGYVLTVSGSTADLEDGKSVSVMTDSFTFSVDSSMAGVTNSYYFILYENDAGSEGVTYDNTVYGIKLDVTLISASDLTDVTILETYYKLELSNSSDEYKGYNIYTVAATEEDFELEEDNEGNTIYPFTNTYSEYVDITVNKAWDDSDNQDGERPTSIKVKLVTDGVESDEAVELNSDNNWSYTWEDLPVFADEGGEITYTVIEVEVPEDYQSTVGDLTPVYDDENNFVGYTITIANIHESAKTDISVVKAWDDEDDQDGIRPESVTVQLKADGVNYEGQVVLSDSNDWSYSWEELPLHNGSTDYITYTVEEVEIKEGYTPNVTWTAQTDDDGTVTGYLFTITNSYTPEETSLTVIKNWDDEDDQDGIRPNSISVQLLADEEAYGEAVILTGDDWTYTWVGLPVYSDGEEISYTVVEDIDSDVLEGYTPSYGEITENDDGSYGITITNIHIPATTSLTVTKNWVNEGDISGTTIRVQLMADGETYGDSVTLTESDNWKYTWTDLPVNSDGKNVVYTLEEDPVDGYASSIGSLTIDNDGNYSVTITNTRTTGSVTFGGEKTIKGISGTNQTFAFSLYASNEEFKVDDDALAISTKIVEGAGSFTFDEISYDSRINGNGAGIYYYVVKETSTDENGWTMDTNEYHITVDVTYSEGDSTFTIEVTCTDAKGTAGTLTQAENGSYSFTGLDFENNYEAAPTSVQFTGTKYITNSTSTEKVFTFELYTTEGDFSIEGLTPEQVSTEGEITSSGQEFKFDEIKYEEAGTHYYVIQEKALDAEEGWTIDSKVYNITVVVSDDGEGQLQTTVTIEGRDGEVTGTTTTNSEDGSTQTEYGGFDFTNGYAAEGEVILGVVKSISGVASTEKEFSFTLYESDEDFTVEDEIATIKTDGSFTDSTELNFETIKIASKDGEPAKDTYYYVIKETGTAPDGWTIDSKEYHVTVTVTDNGNGTLITEVSYAYVDEEGETKKENSAAFTNTYKATGELNLTGKKTYEGGTLGTNVFGFTMTGSAGESVGEVTMDSDGNITFPTLKYDETDIGETYSYTITEVDTNGSGIVYDENIYTVIVSVADNENGTLKVTYTVTTDNEEKGSIEFVNYQKGSLIISKTFTGLTDEQIASLKDFEITVKNSVGDTVATLKLEDATSGDDENYTWTVSNLEAGAYTVAESGYSVDGYEVIAKSGEVEVINGSLVSVEDEVEWGDNDDVAFTNDYIEVGSIKITKYVVAEKDIQEAHEDTEYTVVITASGDTDFQWVTVTSSTGREITPTKGDKTITFTITENETVTISGLPAGEYTVEEQGSDAMTSEHCVPTYIIGEEETEEAPTVTVSSGNDNIVKVEIDNEYPIGTYIQVKKNYNKDEYPTGDDAFTFTIEALTADLDAGDTLDASDMPMPTNNTVTITGSDDGYIGLLTFDNENNEFEHFGTYYYKITETKGSLDNVEYDESVHYVKVVVAFDEGTHVLTTDEYEAKADEETDDYKDLDYTEAGIVSAEFTNTAYDKLTIEKEVSGNAGDTTVYEFEITLTKDGEGYTGDIEVADEDEDESDENILTSIANWFSGVIKFFRGDGDDTQDGEEESENEGTITFTDGKATITIEACESVTLLIPSGWDCTITEKTTGADTTTVYDGDGNVIVQAKGTTTEATAEIGTVAESTQVKFVNSYRAYYPIDEEIVTDTDDIFDRDAWVKDESVNEYNAIEIEMTTNLPVVTAYDLENGDFTMNFHEVLDHELILDEDTADFSVYIGEVAISTAYYRITFDDDTGDDCNFHVDVDLTALYNDGIVKEEMLDGNTEITIFFFADLEGTGLNGSYTSTIWYDIYDGDEWLYTSNESVVAVYTYEIEIRKYDVDTDDNLSGATFGIYYDENCTDPVSRYSAAYTTVSDGEGMAIFYGLADGTYYVQETEAPNGYVLSNEVLTVELGEALNNSGYAYKAEFANTPKGDLTVSKTVSGSGSSTDTSFTFEVSLGTSVNGTYTVKTYDKDGNVIDTTTVTFTNGQANKTFELKADQSFTIEGLPSGVAYIVREIDSKGYTSSITRGYGDGTVTGDGVSVTFNNYRGSSSSTGGSSGGGSGRNTGNTGPGATVTETEAEPSESTSTSINTDDIGDLPQTGESNTAAILMGLCAVFVVLLGGLFYMRRKTPNEDE